MVSQQGLSKSRSSQSWLPPSCVEVVPGRVVQRRLEFRAAALKILFVHINPALRFGARQREVRRICPLVADRGGERMVIMWGFNIRSGIQADVAR